MSYEFQLSVQHQDTKSLREFCSSRGMEYVCFLNSGGSFPLEATISQKESDITIARVIAKALALKTDLTSHGRNVLRTKVEEILTSETPDARSACGYAYFEARFKVFINSKEQRDSVLRAFSGEQACFSRDVTKFPSSLQLPTEQLVTLRMRNTSCEEFYEKIAKLQSTLDSIYLKYEVCRKYMIYDDN